MITFGKEMSFELLFLAKENSFVFFWNRCT